MGLKLHRVKALPNMVINIYCKLKKASYNIFFHQSSNGEISLQGSRLRRPSMLYTRYFGFGREFRLTMRSEGRDFYFC